MTTHEDTLAIVAFVLLVGVFVAIAGICISAAGAPEIGVVDDWGRADEAAGRVATWELVLVVLAAVVISTRRDRWKSATLVLALVEAALIVVGVVVGVLAVLEREFVGPATPTDLYSDGERIGEISVYVGLLLSIIAIGWFAVHELRAEKDQASA